MLQSFSHWCYGLPISQIYRDSKYLFALTQVVHLVGVTAFIGAILIGDLRLLGWGPIDGSRTGIARSAQRILLWSGLGVLVTGIPQFLTNSLTYGNSPLFLFKMSLLAVALVYTATLRRWVAFADEGRVAPWARKAVGALSIALWIGVTISGRLITYYG